MSRHTTTDTSAPSRGGTSMIARSQSIILSAASMAFVERPPLGSRILSVLLTVLMVTGLLSFVAALTMLAAVAVCEIVVALKGSVSLPAVVFSQAQSIARSLWQFIGWTMLGSTVYGFASFLWYKLEITKAAGQIISWAFFFIVPIGLILLKQFQGDVALWLERPVPVWAIKIAEYYSLFWYVLLFLFGIAQYRAAGEEGAGRTLTRWSLLTILCYIPYGYVLFVGEADFYGAYLKNYIGDCQLILWVLLPIRR